MAVSPTYGFPFEQFLSFRMSMARPTPVVVVSRVVMYRDMLTRMEAVLTAEP